MFKDTKDINKLGLKVPDVELYENLKTTKLKIAKIKAIYTLSNYKFFITDKDNNIICKVKRKKMSFNDNYIIYNPYNKQRGDLTFREGRKNLGYDVYLYKGNNFVIEKKVENDSVNYEIDSLPLFFKGDSFGSNFDVLDKNTKKIIAKVKYYAYGKKGMEYEIKFKNEDYNLEIFLSVICTKLIQISMMN